MVWSEGTNQYWFERNHTVPKLSISRANEIRKQNGLDYWREGNLTARSYKTPWNWLRVWLYGDVPECLWCPYAKTAICCLQADIDIIYNEGQRGIEKLIEAKKSAAYYEDHIY